MKKMVENGSFGFDTKYDARQKDFRIGGFWGKTYTIWQNK